VLDKFIQIIETNNISPEDIEKVEYTPMAITLNRMWQENTLQTEEDFAFHGPYLIGCAAYRVNPIDFISPKVMKDPKIREFMKKVVTLNVHRDFGKAILEDPDHIVRLVVVTVYAKGKVYTEENRIVDWTWNSSLKAEDNELIDKFKNLTSGYLSSANIKRATEILFRLQELKDVNELTELLIS